MEDQGRGQKLGGGLGLGGGGGGRGGWGVMVGILGGVFDGFPVGLGGRMRNAFVEPVLNTTLAIPMRLLIMLIVREKKTFAHSKKTEEDILLCIAIGREISCRDNLPCRA